MSQTLTSTAAAAASRGVLNLRAVRADDAQAMAAFIGGLSSDARRMRFHGAVNASAPGLLRHLTQVDGLRHVAFVACAANEEGAQEIVGEARYVVDDDSAEFAIAVADTQRGCGLADALLQCLIKDASAAGVQQMYGDVLDSNARMAAFVGRHGFEVDALADAEPGVRRWQRRIAAQPQAERQPTRAARLFGRWMESMRTR